MSTTSATIALDCQGKEALAASASRLVGYDVPVSPTHKVVISDGTGAGTYAVSTNAGSATAKAVKTYQASGTASAAVVDIDLTTVTCVDGTTGFSYVRWAIIFNDATTTAYTLTTGGGTNPFKPYLAGTTPTFAINPGVPFVVGQPLATNGYTVDGSNKVLRLDPGANNVPYRIVVWGS